MDLNNIPVKDPKGEEALTAPPAKIVPQYEKHALIALMGVTAGAYGAVLGSMFKPGVGTTIGYIVMGQGIYLLV